MHGADTVHDAADGKYRSVILIPVRQVCPMESTEYVKNDRGPHTREHPTHTEHPTRSVLSDTVRYCPTLFVLYFTFFGETGKTTFTIPPDNTHGDVDGAPGNTHTGTLMGSSGYLPGTSLVPPGSWYLLVPPGSRYPQVPPGTSRVLITRYTSRVLINRYTSRVLITPRGHD